MTRYLRIAAVVIGILWVVFVEWRLLFLYYGENRLADLHIEQNGINDVLFEQLRKTAEPASRKL
jgi:hypothetical protein